MRNALFSITVLRYPSVIRVMAVAITALAWLALPLGSGINVGSIIINIVFTVFAALAYWLVERYYEAVTFSICFILIALTSFSCGFLYIVNSGPTFPINLVAIMLCGVLLGGRGATLTTIWTLIWLGIDEAIVINRWLPVPTTYVGGRVETVNGITSNLLVVVMGYVTVVFFASVVQRALGEIGGQRDALRAALAQLEEKQAGEQRAATAVSHATSQLSDVAYEQTHGAQEQAAAVVQVSKGAEHLDYEAQLIATSAKQISELVGHVADEAQQGKQMLDNAVVAQQQSLDTVATTVAQSSTLAESVNEVRVILSLLSDIAQETRILSLNAAIEAAAAENSNSGKRFAVIADEVQELANRAANATEQVQTIVNQIEGATTATVDAVKSSMKDAKRSMIVLGQVSDAAQRLRVMAQDASNSTNSILTSSEEQRREAGQVADTMRQMSHVAEKVATSAAQVQAVVGRLGGLVAALQG